MKNLSPTNQDHRYGASIARIAYLLRSFMRLQGEPIVVKGAAAELGFAVSTIHRVLGIMLKHGLATFVLAGPSHVRDGQGCGRLYLWSAVGTPDLMESTFGTMPDLPCVPTPTEDMRPQAYPSVFHMGQGKAVFLPTWKPTVDATSIG